VDFEEETMSCVGVAVRQHLTEVTLVLDVGGQSITSMLLDREGDVVNFMRNDKCASGSGRFLEVMSQALGIPITELDQSAARAARPAPISSQCGVFVESEVITHLNAGIDPAEISAGLCDSVARIVVSQARRFAGDDKIAYSLTGGVARVQSVVDLICQRLEGTYNPFPLDPQLAAAYGAALLAAECEEG
jgi:predicted CoA-substrate-specific enzyme activase